MKSKYFSDFNGNTTELFSCRPMSNSDFAKQFPGITGKRRDSFTRIIGVLNGQIFPITRVVFYKRNPSLHECSSKCRHGKCGGTCECQCGGKNHGVANAT